VKNEELDAVSEAREWRRQMTESWKGKSWEEIKKELNDLGTEFRREMEEERSRKKEGAA
jgi:hypothetical protein